MKINSLMLITLFFLSCFILLSCSYSNSADLNKVVKQGNNPPPPPATCDLTTVTYSKSVVTILGVCQGCHSGNSPSAGIQLGNYASVKTNGQAVLAAIKSGEMPQGGPKLSACDISKIEEWIKNGTPNN